MILQRVAQRLTGAEAGIYEARLAERAAHLHAAQAVVREREAVIREREGTVREREAAIEVLHARAAAAPRQAPTPQPDDGADITIEALLPRLEGWCTLRKATWLAQLVTSNNARRICEIGAYGGRSLLPMALAARHTPGAEVWAVEPWSNRAAVAQATNDENDQWWSNVDLQAVKQSFLANILACGLAGIVKIVELTSDTARLGFLASVENRFDLLHIDGSHAEAQALADVTSWLPLVAPGGIIVLDDIGWDTVARARDYLRATCSIVDEITEDSISSYGAYRVPAK